MTIEEVKVQAKSMVEQFQLTGLNNYEIASLFVYGIAEIMKDKRSPPALLLELARLVS